MTKLVYEGPEQSVSELSGGNQQKAIFARWLEHDLALLLLDEPTRGVDVRAREELHEVIRELAYSGTNVIIASNDLKELMDRAIELSLLFKEKLPRVLEGVLGRSRHNSRNTIDCLA